MAAMGGPGNFPQAIALRQPGVMKNWLPASPMIKTSIMRFQPQRGCSCARRCVAPVPLRPTSTSCRAARPAAEPAMIRTAGREVALGASMGATRRRCPAVSMGPIIVGHDNAVNRRLCRGLPSPPVEGIPATAAALVRRAPHNSPSTCSSESNSTSSRRQALRDGS